MTQPSGTPYGSQSTDAWPSAQPLPAQPQPHPGQTPAPATAHPVTTDASAGSAPDFAPAGLWPGPTGSYGASTSAPHAPAGAPGFTLAPGTFPPPAGPTPRPRSRWAGRIAAGAMVVALGLASGAAGALLVTSGATPQAATTTVTQVVQGTSSAPDWSVTAAAALPSTVSITVTTRSGSGVGSGVVWDTEGHIVTNNHVVSSTGTSSITVELADGRTYAATIVATDPAHDLAVLALADAPDDLVPIQLGDDTTLQVGDPVMAIGNPLGLEETVTTGIVSAVDREVPTSTSATRTTSSGSSINAIQVSAPINPGNSGGALVDAEGRLVGINFSIAAMSADSGSIGIGFAIPVSDVKTVVEEILQG